MDARALLLHRSQQVEVVAVWQLRVDAADHVHFDDRHIEVRAQGATYIIEGEQVGLGAAVLWVLGEEAEAAVLIAYIGVVYVLVTNIVSTVAVQSLTHLVRKVSNRCQVRVLK